MGLKIASRLFSGPYGMSTFKRRRNQSAVIYAVVSKSGPPWDPDHHLVDLGTHDDDGLDFAALARAKSWQPIGEGTLMLFIYFLDDRRTTLAEREAELAEMRSRLEIPGAFIPIA